MKYNSTLIIQIQLYRLLEHIYLSGKSKKCITKTFISLIFNFLISGLFNNVVLLKNLFIKVLSLFFSLIV